MIIEFTRSLFRFLTMEYDEFNVNALQKYTYLSQTEQENLDFRIKSMLVSSFVVVYHGMILTHVISLVL